QAATTRREIPPGEDASRCRGGRVSFFGEFTPMAAVKHDSGMSASDHCREVLELIHGWLTRQEVSDASLVDLIRNLAAAFAASAAGVAALADGVVLVRETAGVGP